ncbi:glucosamine-6-phosphate deaminase [Rossellomorea oryzaecorticis]|uniref:Glucosamine-6-phosphate deaminase n=1 Tax=Rossellomorea oryzaecorticis TaxID=1396505 RepID=A0ABU9K6U7_9BACI
MKIIVKDNYKGLSRFAAECIQKQVQYNPGSVLGLATGSTPLGLYERLVQDYKVGGTDYSKVSTINLDEYVGLSKTHPQSYHMFMKENLFSLVNIASRNTYIPDGKAKHLEEECKRYDRIINTIGPPDLLILGIGENGHIGFNEPGSSFEGQTHIVELKESTRRANARLFSSIEEVPKQAITMGIKSILYSKKILLLASGEKKKEAIGQLLTGKIDEQFPASALHLHPNVTVVVDELAYNRQISEAITY